MYGSMKEQYKVYNDEQLITSFTLYNTANDFDIFDLIYFICGFQLQKFYFIHSFNFYIIYRKCFFWSNGTVSKYNMFCFA